MSQFSVSHVVVGDELGLIKKLEITPTLDEITSPKVLCVNRDTLEQPSPDKAVLTIRRFVEPYYLRSNAEATGLDSNENLFLICSKANRLQLYNGRTDELNDIKPNLSDQKLSGSVPFRENFIVNCYQNGSIYVQNIEKEILAYASNTNKKALKVLGLDVNNNSSSKDKKEATKSSESSLDDLNRTSKKNKNNEGTGIILEFHLISLLPNRKFRLPLPTTNLNSFSPNYRSQKHQEGEVLAVGEAVPR